MQAATRSESSTRRPVYPFPVAQSADGSLGSPSLGSATLLQLPSAGGAVASPFTRHTHQATLYPTCGVATVTFRSAGQGRQFTIVTATDAATGEITRQRQYQRDRADAAAVEASYQRTLISRIREESPDLEPSAYRRWWLYERNLRRENRECWQIERRQRAERSACRRAAAKLKRYCRHNGLDHLVTLTYAGEGISTWDQIVYDWRIFLQSFQAEAGHHAIAGVIEPHPGGHGYHIHFGIRGRLDLTENGPLRRCWRKGHGYGIDAQWLGRHGRAPKRVSGYLAKYVAKTITPEALDVAGIVEGRRPGQHRYFVAEGKQPEVVKMFAYGRWQACEALRWYMGKLPVFWWCSDTAQDWEAPRVDYFDWWEDDGASGAVVAGVPGGR